MKVKNLLLVILFCCFLLGPLTMSVAVKVGCELPDWLLDARLEYLEGDDSVVSIQEHLGFKSFMTGELQEAIEMDAGNSVPLKSSALLTNAAAQRTSIEISNALFGWGCYPTYYGSRRLYAKDQNALYRFPFDMTKSSMGKFDMFTSYLNEIATAYPDKQFYVYFVDSSPFDLSNPSEDLVSSDMTSVSECARRARNSTYAANIVYIGDEVPKAENYHQYFYASDHHWNGFGTKRAYDVISRMSGLDVSASLIEGTSSFKGLRINGSDARVGLMLLDEPVTEPLFNFSDVKIVSGNLAPVFISGTEFVETIPLQAEFGFYHSWFGTGNLVLENDRREERVLLVGDSYTFSLRWLLGNTCRTLVQRSDFVDGRPEKLKEDGRGLRDFIDSMGPEKVILVASPSDFVNMVQEFEEYFL